MPEKDKNMTKKTTTKEAEKTAGKTTATASKSSAASKTAAAAPKGASATKTAAAKPAAAPKQTAAAKKAEAASKTAAPKAATPKAAEAAPKAAALKSASVSDRTAKPPVEESETFSAANVQSGESTRDTAALSPRDTRIVLISLIGYLLLMFLVLGLVLGLVNGNAVVTVNAYKNATLVGYSAKTIDTVERYKPVDGVHDEGLATGYPTYGYTLRDVIGGDEDKVAQRQALINEANYLAATGTANAGSGGGYTWMDKDGMLYSGSVTEPVPALGKDNKQRQLYQHTSSVGLYLGDVADDEPGIVKQVTMRPRGYSGYGVTGVYAPAGEVLKVTLSKEDMEATGGIVIHIGQALYNGQANNIWAAKNQMNRIPVLLTSLTLSKDTTTYDESTGVYTGYIGSFIGGPVYIRNESVTFTATISGGVTYSHFILGYTSPEEFEENAKSSAPYFDLEVWDYGVLHSGPVAYAKSFSYDELYKAAVLWEKVSLVSTQRAKQGIVFLYDPFVAAGAAVAFPGRRSVNCPMGWMTSSLNYNSIVTSGSWGNFHEYNHNFQGYGCGDDGEVTNNALTLVSYSLFTKISSARQLASYGGAGLSGWNCYTSATWALERVNQKAISSTNGLAVYATLLHNLGQDAFMKSSTGRNNTYFQSWANVTHQDMSYYASLVSTFATQTDASSLHEAQKDYPMFVPVSSVYQTGRSYLYDGEKRYIETMQPYVIPYGSSYTVDLSPYSVNSAGQYQSGSVVMPSGFSYKIKEVKAEGVDGSFLPVAGDTSGYLYTFTPGKELRSGKIYVTLEITNESNTVNGEKFSVDDVDLVLEFEQSHETKKAILERTTYTYAAGSAYTSATEAYENNYAGYTGVEEGDNINPVQNSNTDIWYSAPVNPLYPDYIVPENSVAEVKGKLYIPETGKYRIVLRGRLDAALYLSLDGGANYELAVHLSDVKDKAPSGSAAFRLQDSNGNPTYIDLELNAESWVYFKMVLICTSSPTVSYMGLGIAQWKVPLYTTETITDQDGNIVEIKYYDESGREVTAEEASRVDPIEPTSISYATAYRSDYEFMKEFTSEYFYTRNYNYNYDNKTSYSGTPVLVSVSHDPWDSSRVIDYLLDGNTATSYHSKQWVYITEEKPFELNVDLGETFTANHVTFYGYHASNTLGNLGMPVTFTLYGSLDGETFFEIVSRVNMEYESKNVTFEFDETQLRYYKLHVTLTDNERYFAMSEISFYYETVNLVGNGNNFFSPDHEMFTYRGNWSLGYINAHFGHVYIGKKNATIEFEFEGTRLGVLSSEQYGANFVVYIDGKKTESVLLKEEDGDLIMTYVSPELSEGKHSVKIECKGEANFDAFCFF